MWGQHIGTTYEETWRDRGPGPHGNCIFPTASGTDD